MTYCGGILVREGLVADLNVIDPETVAPDMPTVVHDLPAGGKRIEQKARGILATVVAGEVVHDSGKHTGALPGRLLLARAYAGLGRTAEAERVLTDANEHADPHLALHEPMAMIAQAWLAAGRGGERTGIDLPRTAADTAHRAGQFAAEAEALHHAARFGDRTVAARLGALAKRVDGTVAALYARHAAALAGSDPRALDAIASAV